MNENHIVIDLETYGVTPGSVVLSIGAVQFDPFTGISGKKFFQAINIQKSILLGFHKETKTIDWWKQQSTDAYMLAHSGTESPVTVLKRFSAWFNKVADGQPVYVWGNSAKFDLGILCAAYRLCGLPYPIDSFLERDYRTLYTQAEWTRNIRWETPFQGLKHDPVNDCLHAAKVISGILMRINKMAA